MLADAMELVREIRAHGRAAVIVGGAVRDLLLGRPLTDVDLATDMPISGLSTLFRTHAVGRSESFETVVVSRGGHVFEISRFRGGRKAPAASPVEAPAAVAELLAADSAHRDFTINAMFMGLDGRVVDLQGGREDLKNRVVRCVGSPRERFAEDPARVLRAVRFAACLGFTIEEETARSVAAHAPHLASVAGERIGKEILKMAAQQGGVLASAVALMDRFGVLEVLLPEVKRLQGLPQPAGSHPEGDAFAHTLAALRASTTVDPAVNLAVLLHDVGKHTAHREAAGRHRYGGHEREGAGIAGEVGRRLHLPHRMRAALAFAVDQHMKAGRFVELRRSTRLALLANPHWPVLRSLALSDCAARGDDAATGRLDAAFRAAETDAATALEAHGAGPLITGSRIMELTGLPPGPRIGEIQRRVSAWALDNRIEDTACIEAAVARAAARPARGSSAPPSA